MQKRVTSYRGNDPFIFISYAHSDTNRVMPILERLQLDGYRVWYDEGIEVGKDWAKYIVQHLKEAACMIAFISKNYLVSENCIDEIEYSKNEKVPTLMIYLEDVEQPEWMKLRHGRTQAIFCSQYGTGYRLFERIYEAEIIAPCKTENAKSEESKREHSYQTTSSQYHVQQDASLPQWYAIFHHCENILKKAESNTVFANYFNVNSLPKEDTIPLKFSQKYSANLISDIDVARVQVEKNKIQEGKKSYFVRQKLDTIQLNRKNIDIYDVISSDFLKFFAENSLNNNGLSKKFTSENYLYGVVQKSYQEQPEIVFISEFPDGSLKLIEDPLEFQVILIGYLQLRFLGLVPLAFQDTYKRIQEIDMDQNFDVYLEFMGTTSMDLFHQVYGENDSTDPELDKKLIKKSFIEISTCLTDILNENRIACERILGWNPRGLFPKKVPIEITASKYQLTVIAPRDKQNPFNDLVPAEDDRYPMKSVVTPLDTLYLYPRIKNPLIGYTVIDIVRSIFAADTYYLLAYPQRNHCIDKLQKEPVYFIVEKDAQHNLSIKQYLPSEDPNSSMDFKYIYERFALIAGQTDFFCSWIFDDTRIVRQRHYRKIK